MAVYAVIEKVDEDARRVRYRYSGVQETERFVVLDKEEERVWPEDGVEDHLYGAVARRIAVMWAREGIAPQRLVVQS
ncbi:hypothetical protein E1265_36340 [Streptomyces sp. 8K308]|uniref:hypothetical protein n=1 Tax=Streptomyces sp. 8K308 TaxID=2530388 RepID=UPI001043D053|nr:hypothetical protein [Streptomyces sp. 8K308]TDC03736.1 hypothetical protein E1265_36340 [Streptomyces sp. 8K308]